MTSAIVRDIIFDDVTEERVRQFMKWGDQEVNSLPTWMAIIGEEYGEVCKEVLEKDILKLRKELIQMIAVAVHVVENIDQNVEMSFR